MLNIESGGLRVEVLEPVLDRTLMGTRFCAGGQVYQVYDKDHGALLSGPTYPGSYNSFDSQGLPDGFTVYPGFEKCEIGDAVMVIGVGLARYTDKVIDISGYKRMSVIIKGSEQNAIDVARFCELFYPATSLGGVESLIEHRKTVSGDGFPVL